MPEANGNLWSTADRSLTELAVRLWFLFCAVASIFTTLGIVWVLIDEAMPFFGEVSIGEFLGGDNWNALMEPYSWGVLPLLVGTLQIAVGAAIVAIPLGVAVAVFLSEYASRRLRNIIKPILEILAGIPTVVYGYFALTAITPLLRDAFGAQNISVFNGASASMVVGIMILPMVASLSDDAMRAVPRSLRDAGYAVGATKFEVSSRIVLPGALSGILASFVLAISRAVGETMAVTLAAGATPTLTMDPTESIQTMTSFIVQVTTGDAPHGTMQYYSLFAVALVLFVMTLTMNLIAHFVMRRFREVYE